MNGNLYRKLFPSVMVLTLLSVSCFRGDIVGTTDRDEKEPDNSEGNSTSEILLPVKGSDTYDSDYTIGADFTPAKPNEGYAALSNAVKYPESAFSEGIEGVVLLSIHLRSDGTIQEIIPMDNIVDHRLLGASIDAVLSVEWLPAIQEGVPADSYITLPIRFSLDK